MSRARGASRPGPSRLALVVVPLAALLVACSGGSGAGGTLELRVAAAASLRAAAASLGDAYARANPGVRVVIATDSSATLRAQVEQGAPFDVFLSADLANARALADAGLAYGEPVSFAANAVALIVPADNPAGVATPADLARPGLRIIAAGVKVPITAYADQVVDRLAGLPGYPIGFADAVARNIVSREDNVAAVLAKVELGEGDAGFVYATDALAGDRIRSIAIPDAAAVPTTYAGVVVGAGPHRDAAAAFLAFVAGPDGRAVLARLGFVAP